VEGESRPWYLEKVVEALEELQGIRAYDEAKKGPQDTAAFERAISEINSGSNM
jgi:hypothetical protein